MNDLRLSDLIDLAAVQAMAESLYRTTSMPIGIIDALDGSILVESGWQEVCTRFHRVHPEMRQRCLESDAYIQSRLAGGEPCAYKCKNGLWDIGIPIIANRAHLATVFLGQFFYEGETPPREDFIAQGRKFGFDLDAYLVALDRVPHFSREKVASILAYNRALAGFITDLAEKELGRRNAEAARRQSEALLRAIFDSARDSIFVKDAALRYIKANPAMAGLLGLPEGKILGSHDADLFGAEAGAHTEQVDRRVLAGEVVEEYPSKPVRGEVRHFHTVKVPLRDDGGSVVGLCGIARDITERRQAEDALRRNEEKYRLIFKHSPLGLIYFDAGGVIRDCNDNFVRIIGSSREALVGLDMRRLPDLELAAALRQSLDGRPAVYEGLYQSVTAPKKTPVRVLFAPMAAGDGRRHGGIGIVEDVTERKRAEDALRKSEERLRLLSDLTMEGILIHKDGIIRDLNPSLEKLLGYEREELIGRNILEVAIHEDDREIVRQNIIKEYVEPYVVRALRKNGGDFRAELEARNFRFNDETLRVTAVRDITERLRAREALLAAERKWRNVLVNTPQVGVGLDREGRIVFANRHFLQLTGWSEEEVLGRDWFETCLPSEAREEIRGVFYAVMNGAGKLDLTTYENKIMTRDGERRNLAWSNVLTRDADGTVLDVTCLGIDLTERKRAEDALRASERRYRDLYENLPVGVYQSTLEGRIVAANRACLDLAHCPEADREAWYAQDTRRSYADPEDAQRLRRRLLEHGRVENFEARFNRWDGTTAWFSNSARLIRNEAGEPVAISGCFVDITERRRAEADRARLTAAIEQASEVIVITDRDGAIQYVNPAFEHVTGYGRDEVRGRNPRILKSGVHDEAFYRDLWQTILAGETWRGRLVNRKKNGALCTEEAAISPVFDADRTAILNFVAVKRDITDELKMQEKIAQIQKMESIGNLAGGIAHDFNNILFPILGMAELLIEDLPDGSLLQQNAQEIFKAGKRGSDLVKQILAFSRQSEHRLIPVGVQQVLKEVLRLCRRTIPADIEIDQKVQADCGMVMADPTQLHQIGMNLITNAWHAVEETGGRITVALEEVAVAAGDPTAADIPPGRYVKLTIADNGAGIDPALVDKIFEPYFTTKAQGKGTGLGLAVVYGIVKEHGGYIDVRSALGRGTAFGVYLPLLARAVAAVRSQTDDALPRGTERILLVDDEEAIAGLERKMLERLGYRVRSRTSSLEALEAFKANPDAYDLVITDMTMPNMTGDRLAQALRAIRPDLPVVICTGFSERIDRERAAAMGIRGFLMKPVVSADLARTVREVLDGGPAG